MTFTVSLEQAAAEYPEYTFISPLTPSEQKAAFHVKQGDRDLCLKIIAPNYNIDRLDREILSLQTISHPNVVRLVEYTRESKPGQQRHYIVEEYVAGFDLSERLRPGECWLRLEVSSFFALLCDGLAALEDLRIVHRDLKPSNIRIRTDGSPVIIDFGLARLLDQPDITSTREGAQIGTTRYFSPEQFTGTKHDIDHRTDLFALGILVYDALVGIHPFWRHGMTDDQFRLAICESDDCLGEPGFAALPGEWKTLVGRLLRKQRAERPYGAAQVAALLRRLGGT